MTYRRTRPTGPGATSTTPREAEAAGNPIAGNQPIKIAGLSVRDRLSFDLVSPYTLGGVQCTDIRSGCS